MWTALWQELSDVSATLVGCDHVFGLLMRRGWPLAPNALRGSGPNPSRWAPSTASIALFRSVRQRDGEKWPNLFPLRGESVFSRISL